MANSNFIVNGVGFDGNEWDDSELIKAYDKAVKGWRKSKKAEEIVEGGGATTSGPGPWTSVAKKESGLEEARRRQQEEVMVAVGNWIVGSPCRALYTQDGLEYEAKVVAVEGPTCTIRFVGYGNEEKKGLLDLKETFGKRSRDRQRREAQVFNYSVQPEGAEVEEYYSSVSLTSSMYNNCAESVLRGDGGDDDQQTTTTECSRIGAPHLTVSTKTHKKVRNGKSPKRKRADHNPEQLLQQVEGEPELLLPCRLNLDLETEEVLPSGAEATMGSSSSSDISIGEDGDDEATSGPGVFNTTHTPTTSKGFGGMTPRFPIPPLPLSLAGEDGKFDFGRGHLPSLLLSWYMSGYHAGYFDARQELATSSNSKNKKEESPKTTRNKRL